MKLEYRKECCDDFLCDYYRIHELINVQDLVNEISKLEKDDSRFKFIITLDDIGQACYTSMHSIMSNDLDGGEWLVKEDLDESWFDGDFLRDDLTLKQKITIRKLGLHHGLSEVKFEDIYEKLLYLDEDTRVEMMEANRNLLSIIDKDVYLLKVPVENRYEALYAFPNGYFSCDLSPFENYLLAKHLEENYGYHFFGIGASYISFIKGPELSDERVNALLDLLHKLYVDKSDPELMSSLKETILNKQILTLRYSE